MAWNEDEIENIVTMYPCKTNKEIAKYMNTTEGAIELIANRMQLKKSSNHIAKVRRKSVNKRFQKEVE